MFGAFQLGTALHTQCCSFLGGSTLRFQRPGQFLGAVTFGAVALTERFHLDADRQLGLARDLGLPVLLHVRRSQDRVLKHLRAVFGRMVASEDQIKLAEATRAAVPLFLDKETWTKMGNPVCGCKARGAR